MESGVSDRLQSILEKLQNLYGEAQADVTLERIEAMIKPFLKEATQKTLALSQRDILVIAYGDHLTRHGEFPLATLKEALQTFQLPIDGLHILPFFPYSSDDGFSVIDYYQVNPALGSWDHIQDLCQEYRGMFDAVFNHISVKSAWFQAFLRGDSPYSDYFITVDPSADLSLVTRPRTLPLLTPFDTAKGRCYVWTTFSEDQVDLNYANPDVLLDMLGVLLFYVEQGAQLIRLDAIAFLWKQIGTTCIHLPQTHLIIQLMRDVLNLVSPQMILITETNVPHQENLSYLGDGTNEAQMVYQFPLPPLILHTLYTSDATKLSSWASTIERVGEQTTFFNFTASHDGIGVRPVSEILTDAEISTLVKQTLEHGGFVSQRSNPDGTQSPYELNITYFDAINSPALTQEQPQTAEDRFILSQAIMLAFIGVPGIYLPSLFGARNYRQGVEETGILRAINREKFDLDTLSAKLDNPETLNASIFKRYRRLLEVRTTEPAFHPLGTQSVLKLDPHIFALTRTAPDGTSQVIALHNVSDVSVQVTLPMTGQALELIAHRQQMLDTPLELAPYQALWLKLI